MPSFVYRLSSKKQCRGATQWIKVVNDSSWLVISYQWLVFIWTFYWIPHGVCRSG